MDTWINFESAVAVQIASSVDWLVVIFKQGGRIESDEPGIIAAARAWIATKQLQFENQALADQRRLEWMLSKGYLAERTSSSIHQRSDIDTAMELEAKSNATK